jgi:outer membrane protein, multidrug efflux system
MGAWAHGRDGCLGSPAPPCAHAPTRRHSAAAGAGRAYLTVILAIAALLPALGGCAMFPPSDVDVPVDLPAAFSKSGAAALPQKWWITFGDPRLDKLIDEALHGSFSLRGAWDRLDQARATARRSGAAMLPSLTGTTGVARTGAKTAAGTAHGTGYSLGLAASYELDLWGRVRATRDASVLDALASAEDLNAAVMTLSADVATTWYKLVEQRGQIKLLDEQIKTNKDYLEIITLQFRRGRVSATDVLQQRQLVELSAGERIQAESAAEVLEHQLAVLLGRAPDAPAMATPTALPAVPPLPKTGVPAEWVRRRPDVRSAELRVHAADRSVAAAIADRFPQVNLTAGASTSANNTGKIFDFDAWLLSLAANLSAPLFDGGRRRAEVDRTRAALSEKLNSYGQTVLTSLREVEDALTQEARQAEYMASLQKQLTLSKQSTDQTRENYAKGTTDFTRYLTTLLGHQRLQRTVLQARRQLVLHRINLCRALAGSWTPQRPPATPMSKQAPPKTRPE